MPKNNFLNPKLSEYFYKYLGLDTSLVSGENYRKAIELLEPIVKDCGFKTQIVDIPAKVAGKKNRVNLIAKRLITRDLPTILIYNHIDVVPGRYEDAFKFYIKNGKAFARGTSDMKGATLGVLMGLETLKNKKTRFNLVFVATTDEETGQKEQLKYLIPRLELPKGTVVFDPDTFAGGITVAHLGVFKMRIEVKGKSVHSGMSNLGKNAIEEATKVIEFFLEIKGEYEAMRSKYKTFKSVGLDYVCSRCNVNTIEAGTAFNVVPDKCSFTVDCRYIPEAEVKTEKKKLLERLAAFCRKEKIDYELSEFIEIEGYSSEHPLIDELDSIYKRITGEFGKYGVMGSTDMSEWCKNLGFPHFGVGVARADTNVHGVNEFVYLRDIENLSKTIVKFLEMR